MAQRPRTTAAAEVQAYIREHFGTRSAEALATEVERTPQYVRRVIVQSRPPVRGPWTTAEDAVLRDRLGRIPALDLTLLLGRSATDIQARVAQLAGIAAKRSTPAATREEVQLVRRRYGTLSAEELRAVFGRSDAWVEAIAQTYRLKKDKAWAVTTGATTDMPRWRPDEEERLRKLYPYHSTFEVAKLLGRSAKSVTMKANRLGLGKTGERLVQMGRENVRQRQR